MKKLLIPALIILMATLYFGCSKKKTIVEFDVPYSFDLALPAMTSGTTYTLQSADVLTMINEKLASNSTNGNLVGEANITAFSLAVKTPSTGNLGFIRWVKFYINAINQPELQTAFKYNQQKAGEPSDTILITDKTTSLHINEANLKNRYMENSVYFKYKIEPVSATSPMTITAVTNVHFKSISE